MERTVQMVDGHYQLSLPWNYDKPCLRNNRIMIEKRLELLKGQGSSNESKYRDTVKVYIAQGHARKVPDNQVLSFVWYLPHHPVVHPQKPDKVRVVFDCAAKFCNTSLNEQLFQGPDLTNNLVGVLLRFRQERIGLMSDIEKMFHQVRISPRDTCALSFLWWPDGDLLNRTPQAISWFPLAVMRGIIVPFSFLAFHQVIDCAQWLFCSSLGTKYSLSNPFIYRILAKIFNTPGQFLINPHT